jgi:hypothetical protein
MGRPEIFLENLSWLHRVTLSASFVPIEITDLYGQGRSSAKLAITSTTLPLLQTPDQEWLWPEFCSHAARL